MLQMQLHHSQLIISQTKPFIHNIQMPRDLCDCLCCYQLRTANDSFKYHNQHNPKNYNFENCLFFITFDKFLGDNYANCSCIKNMYKNCLCYRISSTVQFSNLQQIFYQNSILETFLQIFLSVSWMKE